MSKRNLTLSVSEDTADDILVELLKQSYKDFNHKRFDEGRVYLDSNDELIEAILMVLSWYMIPSDYEEFVKNNPKASEHES